MEQHLGFGKERRSAGGPRGRPAHASGWHPQRKGGPEVASHAPARHVDCFPQAVAKCSQLCCALGVVLLLASNFNFIGRHAAKPCPDLAHNASLAVAFEDWIGEHAPEVLDVFCTVSQRTVVFTPFPEPVFPNLSSCGAEFMHQRRHYYLSLGLAAISLFVALGVSLTIARNFLLRRFGAVSDKLFQAFLNSRVALAILVYLQTAVLMAVALLCVSYHTMSEHAGVGLEYWAVYAFMHFSGALLEVILSYFKHGRLATTAYPLKAVFSAMPLISEKCDTAKDIVLSAVALHKGEPLCAVLNVAVLLLSQLYFLSKPVVKAEMLEAYFPVLMAPVTPFDEPAKKDDRSVVVRVRESVIDELILLLLKQATPARRAIGLAEDLPQGFIAGYLAAIGKGTWFCLLSVSLSFVRIIMSTEFVAKRIRRFGLPQLRKRRLLGIRAQNSSLAIGVTKELASINGDYFSALTDEDYDRLVEMVANDGRKQLNCVAGSSHVVVLLLAAALRDKSGQALTSLYKSAWKDINNVVLHKHDYLSSCEIAPLHVAAIVGDEGCIRELQKLGADLEAEADVVRLGHWRSWLRPLHVAVLAGRVGAAAVLIELGADLNAGERTPLHLAAERGFVEIIELLWQYQPESEVWSGQYRSTAMHVAASSGQVESIAKLHALYSSACDGSSVDDILDSHGRTPLHIASERGKVACIGKLHELGAEINAKDYAGNTPMHAAAKLRGGDREKTMDKLQELGGDASITNNDGYTPTALAGIK
eukprot:TRINITY_DN39875_c0_g1_i1.p1 TRINITY_DN39875_c0_g1~~TRINITY_DN39875_c0_g1_i1.p1  ORF type:complete len:788 (+),score=128.69 TRINITY_DN39875_c0_g1_i1:86-2365(+)